MPNYQSILICKYRYSPWIEVVVSGTSVMIHGIALNIALQMLRMVRGLLKMVNMYAKHLANVVFSYTIVSVSIAALVVLCTENYIKLYKTSYEYLSAQWVIDAAYFALYTVLIFSLGGLLLPQSENETEDLEALENAEVNRDTEMVAMDSRIDAREVVHENEL